MFITKESYKDLLSTDTWKEFRKGFIAKHGSKCEICGRTLTAPTNEFVGFPGQIS